MAGVARAAASERAASGAEQVPARVEDPRPRSRGLAAAIAKPRRSSGTAASRARRPRGQRRRARSRRSRATGRRRSRRALSRNASVSATLRAQPVEGKGQHRGAHLAPVALALVRAAEPRAGRRRSAWSRTARHAIDCAPIGRPSSSIIRLSCQLSGAQCARSPQWCCRNPRSNAGLGAVVQAIPNGISPGGWMPALATAIRSTRSSSVGSRRTSRSLRIRSPKSGHTASSAAASAVMGARRYTPPMGAVETMEDFFEKLNAGDREAAVALMDERAEMRVHVGDSVQTLRGVERVGGWFLRGDAGLRMIPGEIRDTGNDLRGGPARRPARRAEPAHRRDVPGRGRARSPRSTSPRASATAPAATSGRSPTAP